MIVVSPYQPSMFDHLSYLHESNGKVLGETPESLPQIGYIATEGSIVVAAGFLRKVEGKMALLDTLATNADCPPAIRHDGIQAIVNSLIDTAKQLELKYFMAFTVDDGIIKRALSLGFNVTDQRLIVLDLSNEPK